MKLNENNIGVLANTLVALTLHHKQGTLYVPQEAIANSTHLPEAEVNVLLREAQERGWVALHPTTFCWRIVDGVVVGVFAPKNCDVCWFTNHVETKAIADAKTSGGQWGNVCARHFVELDCNAGIGRGQFFRFEY